MRLRVSRALCAFHSFATLFAILLFKYDTAIALAEQRKSIFNLTNMWICLFIFSLHIRIISIQSPCICNIFGYLCAFYFLFYLSFVQEHMSTRAPEQHTAHLDVFIFVWAKPNAMHPENSVHALGILKELCNVIFGKIFVREMIEFYLWWWFFVCHAPQDHFCWGMMEN